MKLQQSMPSWGRFRLRTLLVVTAVIAIALAIAGREFQEWRRQERARRQRAQLLGVEGYPGDIPLRRAIPQLR